MKLSPVEIKKIGGGVKAKINQESIALLFAVVVFLSIFYSVFFNLEIGEYEIFEYMKSFGNSRSGYEDFISNAGVNIRNLTEDNQIRELKYYDEPIDEKNYGKREDPFTESF